MANLKKVLRRTLITGIILSLLTFGTGIMSVTASASCPVTNMLFGGFGGSQNSLNSLFPGNSGNSVFGGGNSNTGCPVTNAFGNNAGFSQNNNASCPAANVFSGGNCPTGNCANNNACITGNCANNNTCTTGNCANNNACTTGNCANNNACTTGNCANNNTCTTGNCSNNNNCIGNNCLTDCTNCTDCKDCPECPQCEEESNSEPAKNAFELKKGYTYSLKVNTNGNRNLVVKSSDSGVVTAQLRSNYINGTAVVYLKARNTGNATITICPANNPNVCEIVSVTVKGGAATVNQNSNSQNQSQGQNQSQNLSQNQNQNQSTTANTYAEEVLQYVNEARLSNNLSPLKLDATLSTAAEVRAREISTKFSHTRPDGTSCFTVLREFGIRYSVCGENIAIGYRDAKSVVNAWMNSSGHRANILNPNYKYMGVGKADNGWAQLFIA